ncbi:MAG: helix-turn-helix domain-containing protein [Actinobacteria bacterium]|nr:helix-turn-helix domain-containing protein [Actinomycetota bacterium]
MDRAIRARRLAAVGDPHRLEIVDLLTMSDHTPKELMEWCGLTSSLLAHHLDVLEDVSIIRRRQSSGDRRNRYVALVPRSMNGLLPESRTELAPAHLKPLRALFVCRRNSARSQLAAALWRSNGMGEADSAGTEPAEVIHPLTVKVAQKAKLKLPLVKPQHIDDVHTKADVIISVCDEAREHVNAHDEWLHWSIPDPVKARSVSAFERTIDDLNERIALFGMSQITKPTLGGNR